MSRHARVAILGLLALAIVGVAILKIRSEEASTSSVPPPISGKQQSESEDGPGTGASLPVDSLDLSSGRSGAPHDVAPPEVAASRGRPLLVDLGSDKCIPCRMMAPILESLAEEFADCFDVVVIDVRQDRTAAGRYGIRVIPTQIFYDAEGRELFRHQGFLSREQILAQWESLGIELPPR
ncbi:MAG: thioredoxin fold domain-containing protein [Candidatus Eisenbacteria bacterium]|nr:thioredoxin fold domain-containing protein [Candidatus Eisenbacteria bacterium]